jgi:hypothetical protein
MKKEYAIQNKEGLYYRGSAYGDHRDWTDCPLEVSGYTKEGAEHRCDCYPQMFFDCEIVKPQF